jgi:glutathione S-transferase
MILYGRFLSPFVRRAAIWLALQERPFEHSPLAVMDDYDALRAVNPVGRVPALALDDGSVLIETWAILDWLEDTAPAGRRLLPETGLARREALQDVAIAHNVAEKAVALVYEVPRRPAEFHYGDWIARLRGQVAAGLDLLEQTASRISLEGAPGSVAAAVASYDFTAHMFPDLAGGRPALAALSASANAHPAFAHSALR